MVDLIINVTDKSVASRSLNQCSMLKGNLISVTVICLVCPLLTLLTMLPVIDFAYAQPTPHPLSQSSVNPQALTLPQLTQCARANNPALKIAQAELEKMKSSLQLAQWSRLPALSIEGLFAPLPARRLLK